MAVTEVRDQDENSTRLVGRRCCLSSTPASLWLRGVDSKPSVQVHRYRHDRERSPYSRAQAQPAPHRAGTALRRPLLLRRIERLEAALIDAEARLERVASAGGDPARIRICEQRLDNAWRAAHHSRFGIAMPREFLAWDCLGQFEREMVYLLSAQEREALWTSLKVEAEEKLARHRKQAVAELVRDAGGANGKSANPGPTAEVVAEVLRQIHTASQNRYHKIDRLRTQIAYAGVFLFVLIFGLLLVAGLDGFSQYSATLDSTLVLGTLLGLSGGVLSVAFTVVRTDVDAKIPAVRQSFEVALIRPLIGAALALPVILVVESGLIQVSVLGKTWLIALACFVAGFSERWFLGLMEKVEKRITQDSGPVQEKK